MSVSTKIDSAQGVVSLNNASGITLGNDPNNSGFGPFTTGIVGAIIANTSLSVGRAGVNTVSGALAVTVTMPDPATCPGANFTIRSLSPYAHVLAASAGAMIFATNLGVTGSQLALSNSVGCSVVMQSDGLAFVVLGNRGVVTLS